MAEVEWLEEALDDLAALDKAVAKRIVKKVSWLSKNFDNIVPEPLSPNPPLGFGSNCSERMKCEAQGAFLK